MTEVYHIVAVHSSVKVVANGLTRPRVMEEKEITVKKTILSSATVAEVLHELGLSYEDILIGRIGASVSFELNGPFPSEGKIQFQKYYQVTAREFAGYRLEINVEKIESVE